MGKEKNSSLATESSGATWKSCSLMQANIFPYWLNHFELGIVLLAVKNTLTDTSFSNLSLSNDKTVETIIGEERTASG